MSVQPYFHHIDPFLIRFTGDFGIRWYGLAYLAGLILGGLSIYYLAKKKRTPMKIEEISDFVTYVALGMMIGGRLGYVLFYSPETLTKFSSHFPYWGLLEVNKGGMASHGGIFGIMVACWLYSKKSKLSTFHLIDLTVVGGSLGIFFGRIANFINGELYGRVMETPSNWGVQFPQELFRWVAHPRDFQSQLVSLGPLIEKIETLKTSSGEWHAYITGAVESLNQTAIAKIQFVIGQIYSMSEKGNPEVVNGLKEVLLVRYPSQIYQAFMEGLFVFFILLFVWRKPQKAGVVSGVFGLCYAIARIIGEQFRMPDSHIGYQLLGLTRGQWLSVFMLVSALVYLTWSVKKNKVEV